MDVDTHARPTGPSGLAGRVLDGRYRIGRRIARGGMASVHEAHDLRLDRTVAVKVMHPGLGDGASDHAFAARFVREARAAARLSHPNVVAVYDQGEDHGDTYLAMEYVPGRTLRDVIADEAPLSPSRALALVEPVLSALAAAHETGLVHRDVKPENVLIAADGRIKVADFGLAKAVSADTQHTATGGVLIGTVSYLAPELVVDGRADARADVYAVGVVLYELLTGVKPHTGESPIQVAYRHVNHDVPPPSERVPGLPAYVDALVARATARDLARRPADAAVLLRQVRRVSQALAAGRTDDVDLTADLALDPGAATAGALAEPVSDRTAPLRRPEPGPSPDEPAAHARPLRRPARSERAPRPGPSPRVRRRRRGLVLLLVALLVAGGVGGGAFWYGWARYEAAPSVVGMTRAEAVETLQSAGLEVAVETPVWDADTERGEVLSADPGGGSRVLSGDTVTLTVSRGALLAPQVRGLDEDAAQDALLERDLVFGRSVGRWSETQPEGTVLTSRPKTGTQLEPGDTVNLVVSKGRRPISVGDWTGKPLARAQAALEDRGLTVQISGEEYDDTVPAGHVLAQTPAGGTLNRGDTVTLTLSRGPELVEVPSVRANGVTAAREKLEALGFEVEVKQNDSYFNLGIAVRTDPEAGDMAPKGSLITLYVV